MSWPNLPRLFVLLVGLPASVALVHGFRAPKDEAKDGAPKVTSSHPERAASVLRVPHATGALVADGMLDDPAWLRAPARTGVFVGSDGEPGRPHAEGRLLWNDTDLYIALYAADRDIRSSTAPPDGPLWFGGDAFELSFDVPGGQRKIEISPDGKITDARLGPQGWDYAWQSGVRLGHDVDGTINDTSDEDEEWILEIAVPLSAIGLNGKKGERIGLRIRRCDSNPDGTRVCTGWGDGDSGAVLALD
ncbi:hypothetical protein AKJ09_07408 [Labilithrix luteola]|uniref:Carbohydrate-binding domain-containing protein n=1 Tax=Labilithrix luteola TaxID=1391654 RepID=A0A0K1Q5T3_9BACT|nr:carbohydrate-binding family 9-like protein [Labilithrix luteola]AKV00745.1 hypothetical protein AKJ09_07408 [Labilithrix luteola]